MSIAARYGELFQMSYITRDLDAAMEHARATLGITNFSAGEPVEVEVLSYGERRPLKVRAAMANIGRHQFENAGVAIAALRAVTALRLPAAAFETGVARAEWPARMQRLANGPVAAVVWTWDDLWQEVRERRGEGPSLLGAGGALGLLRSAVDRLRREGRLKALGAIVDSPAAEVVLDGDTAWRLWTKSLPATDAPSKIAVYGDASLAAPLLSMCCIMA